MSQGGIMAPVSDLTARRPSLFQASTSSRFGENVSFFCNSVMRTSISYHSAAHSFGYTRSFRIMPLMRVLSSRYSAEALRKASAIVSYL